MSLPVRTNNILFALVAVIAICLGLYAQNSKPPAIDNSKFESLILLPQSKDVENFTFTDHNGKPFTKDSLVGRWTVMFFGFTNCPDICPTTLQTLGQIKRNLSAQSEWPDIQVVMMSVDPERDTQDKLSRYVPWFDKDFLGVRGDVAMTEAFAKQVGILFFKRELDSASSYEVDHSSSLILFNPQGQYAGVLTPPHPIDAITADLTELARVKDIELVGSSDQASSDPVGIKVESKDKTSLVIDDAWVRLGPPSANALAGYMNLKNQTDSPVTLVSVESELFDVAMMHNTVVEDGIASMNHLDDVVIPANQELQFKPMGLHLMLMRPEKAFQEGDEIDIKLIDQLGEEYQYSFTVKKG